MRRLKIVVADDEAIIRLGLRTMLAALGHEALLAPNGREALNLIRTANPDLALLDIQMPRMSGYDLVRRGLHAVSLAVDGRGPATRLEQGFLDALGVAAPSEMLRHVYARGDDRHWIASLAPVVLTAHAAGDPRREARDGRGHGPRPAARRMAPDRRRDRRQRPPRRARRGGGGGRLTPCAS